MSNDETILFVDDEPNILQSMERQLKRRFLVKTALSGDQALDLLKKEGPVAVVISDMRMPGMNGVELLSKIKELYPDTVRIMLTGNADQDTAVEAVNTGHIFRFLNKPCKIATLATSLALALRQYRLITAEKFLLDNTLKQSVKVLSELLSLTNPSAFSCGYRVKELMRQIAEEMQLPNIWQYEVAALMSQIGCVTVPNDILKKYHSGYKLTDEEKSIFKQHPGIGKKLVEQIPKMEHVADIINNQIRKYEDYDEDDELDDDIALGAQILKTVLDYDFLLHQGKATNEVLKVLKGRKGFYNEVILKKLEKAGKRSVDVKILSLEFNDIVPGMIAEEDIIAKNGTKIIPKGQKITRLILQGLHNFITHIGIQEPIRIRIANDEDE